MPPAIEMRPDQHQHISAAAMRRDGKKTMQRSIPIAPANPIATLFDISVDGRTKGLPASLDDTPLAEIGRKGWNLLRQDVPLPMAVLDIDALEQNSRWIRAVTSTYGVSLCPHGKTTMAPQLFQKQLADGCWGITLSSQHQVSVARHYGVNRIFVANQILDPNFLTWVAQQQEADPDFDLYFLIDSAEGVDLLENVAQARSSHRPFKVLIEIGRADGRTGCRSADEALILARRIARMPKTAILVGVEGFEGAIRGKDNAEVEDRILSLLDQMNDSAIQFEREGLFSGDEILLTAGGSGYFDLVARKLTSAGLSSSFRVVLRSGCYLAHDAAMYEDHVARAIERSPELAELDIRPRQALTVWAIVQSRPGPDVLYLNVGRRDVSYDADLPKLLAYVDAEQQVQSVDTNFGHEITMLYDQHACLQCPEDSPLRPGMLVQLGISHPCTTFDKWDLLGLVQGDLDIIGAVKTFF